MFFAGHKKGSEQPESQIVHRSSPRHRNSQPMRSSIKKIPTQKRKKVHWHADVLDKQAQLSKDKDRSLEEAHRLEKKRYNLMTEAHSHETLSSDAQARRDQITTARMIPLPTMSSVISPKLNQGINAWQKEVQRQVTTQTIEEVQVTEIPSHIKPTRIAPLPVTRRTISPELARDIRRWLEGVPILVNRFTGESPGFVDPTGHEANASKKREAATVHPRGGSYETKDQLQSERSVPPAVPDAPQYQKPTPNTSLHRHDPHPRHSDADPSFSQESENSLSTPQSSGLSRSKFLEMMQQNFDHSQSVEDRHYPAFKMVQQRKSIMIMFVIILTSSSESSSSSYP